MRAHTDFQPKSLAVEGSRPVIKRGRKQAIGDRDAIGAGVLQNEREIVNPIGRRTVVGEPALVGECGIRFQRLIDLNQGQAE